MSNDSNKNVGLIELIAQTQNHLQGLRYSEKSMRNYKSVWNQLFLYAEEKSITHFSMDLGARFLEDHYGYIIGVKPRKKCHMRADRSIQMLSAYQLHGMVFKCENKPFSWVEGFEEIFEKYLAWIKMQGLATSTIGTYKCVLKNVNTYIKVNNLSLFSEINAEHIDKFVLTLSGRSNSSLCFSLRTIRKLLKFAYDNGYHPDDLSALCPVVNRQSSPIPERFTSDEVKRILKVVDRGNPVGKRDYAILLIATLLGIRQGDIENLTLGHIKWDTKRIELAQSKTGNLVSLPLLDEIGWAIIDYLKYGRPIANCDQIFVQHM